MRGRPSELKSLIIIRPKALEAAVLITALTFAYFALFNITIAVKGLTKDIEPCS